MKRQILAMGGGGFLMEPENPLLDDFFYQLSGKTKPKVCFVSTAGGDDAAYIQKFYDAMETRQCEPSSLSLFKAPLGSLRDYVFSKDVIYVGGGNTRNLLVLWKEWGLDVILREAYEAGIVIGGISAGSICWFEEGVTDSIPGSLTALKCLGILEGSNCVHYDGEAERRGSYQSLIRAGMKAGYACDDGVAGYFVNEKLVEFVSSRKTANAYRVEQITGQVIETVVSARYLGAR
jgi:dipeptidase E